MKLSDAISILKSAKIENPRHDARELFIHVGKMTLTELLAEDASCSSEKLCEAVERRRRREPLQYIIGSVGFYRETYKVTPDCLIPRQETEHLVDYAVKNLKKGSRFLDLCTGSGCVAISTLKNTSDTLAVAVDISEPALDVARQNADLNGVSDRIDFICADVLSSSYDNEFHAVLANPPYVTERDYENLAPEIYFEPKLAFVGKDNGLEFYKKILSVYHPTEFFAFEIGFDQGEAIVSLATEQNLRCEITKDYSGNDRLAVIKPR